MIFNRNASRQSTHQPVEPRDLAAYYLHQHADWKQPQPMLDSALDAAFQNLEATENRADMLAVIARAYLNAGKWQRAEQFAHKSLQQNHVHPQAHYTLGYLAYKKQNFSEAKAHFQHSLSLKGGVAARTMLSLAGIQSTLAEQAGTSKMSVFTHTMAAIGWSVLAVITSPKESTPLPFGTLFQIAPTLFNIAWHQNRKNPERVLNLTYNLAKQYPGSALALTMLANLYYQYGDLDNALYWYQRSLHREPAYEATLLGLAQVYEKMEALSEAAECYETLLERTPNSPILYARMAEWAIDMGDTETAMSYFQQALALGKDPVWCSTISQRLAHVYQHHYHDVDAAISALQTARYLTPEDLPVYLQLGLLYFERGYHDTAKQTYYDALKLAGQKTNDSEFSSNVQDMLDSFGQTNQLSAQLYCNLAFLEWTAGNTEVAKTLYEKTIAYDPHYDIPHNNLGVIYLDDLGQLEAAVPCFEKAVALNPEYALAHYNLGRAFSGLGRTLQAAESFSRARTLNEYTHELDTEELNDRLHNLFG